MNQAKETEKTAISEALRELATLTFDMQGRLSLNDYMRLRALNRQAVSEYEALQATHSRLVRALEPFANLDISSADSMKHKDDRPVFGLNRTQFTVGDVRNARALLAELSAARSGGKDLT